MTEATADNSLPRDWEIVPLGEVALVNGSRVAPTQFPDMKYIGMEHVEAHTMRLLGTVPASTLRSTANKFGPDDVLYGRLRPYLNKVYRPDFEGLCSSEFIVFRKQPEIDSAYLQFFLNSWDFVQFASHLTEGDRPRISFDQMRDYPFPLAPLPEQRRIVAALDAHFSRLDAAVAALERAQANLKRYRAAVLHAACTGQLVPTEAELARAEGRAYEPASVLLARILDERRARWEAANPRKKYTEPSPPDPSALPELPEGWAWASVQQLSTMIQYGTSEKAGSDFDGIPVLRMGNIQDGELDFSSLKFMPSSWTQADDFRLDSGDILFNRTNSAELVGKTAVYRDSHPDAVFASYLIRVKVHQAVNPYYVSHYINSIEGRRHISSVVSQQVGQANVNGTKLGNIPIPVPPEYEQQRIVSELDRRLSTLAYLAGNAETAHLRAARLRQALLQRAFSGRLVPQDPNDEPASALLARLVAAKGNK